MNKIYIILLTIVSLGIFSSCDDYLTVEPKDMVSVDKALNSSSGYISAMIGVYQVLQNPYNPSGFMFGSGVDNFANIYTEPTAGFSPALNSSYNFDFDNTNFDAGSGACFLSLYKAIANLNILIENIETKEVLKGDERNLILGEALALRGFLHFDLWRIYGTMPSDATGNSADVLPYSKEFTGEFIPYYNYPDYFSFILDDLEQGRALLAESDPILKYSNDDLNYAGSIDEYEDLEWYMRQNRFNYYAATATLARVELWMGNKEDAYTYAEEVVGAVNTDGTPKFSLGTSADLGNQDYALFTEQLFGIETSGYDDEIYASYNGYCVTSEYTIPTIYPSASDIRRVQLFTTLSSNAVQYNAQVSRKYSYMSEDDAGYKSVPVIRISEMYLILVETAPDYAIAQQYYDYFVNSRFDNHVTINESSFRSELINQYIREFWAEGQLFYLYKRLGLSQLPISNQEMNADKYKVKIPTGETSGDISM